MTQATIKVRTAIACEDLRQEVDGKMFAIGIMNPVIGRGKPRADGTWPPIRLHFILSLDVPAAGEYDLRFRLRPSSGKGGGSRTSIRVQFVEAADNIPFPVGAMRVQPPKEARSFFLEQALDEQRWKRIASWRLEDMTDEEQGQ